MTGNGIKAALCSAFAAGTMILAATAAQAQCPSIGAPIGSSIDCAALATKTITPRPVIKNPDNPANDYNQRNDNLNDLNDELGEAEAAAPATFTSNGTGTFTVISTGVGTPCSANLSPTAISFVGSNPQLGTITTTLGGGAPLSTVTSNQANTEFPATGNLFFNVSVTISSQPGKTFTSRTAINLRNTNLGTFNPHVNETYTQVGSVDLVDAGGNVAYTLSGLSVTLN